MSFSISYNFIAKDKFSQATKAIRRGIISVKRAARKANVVIGKMSRKLKNASNGARNFGNKLGNIGKGLSKKLTLPITLLGGAVLGAAAKMEKLETGFVGMLGSADKAKALVQELTQFTAKTPFQLGDVGGAAKQLLAAGVTVDKMKDKLQILGDISAAANIPLGDMAAIFTKSKNKGKAYTEELQQIGDRGVPIIDILSRGLGVNKDQIFDLASKGKISFEILQKALIQASKKGEFANKAMILQSKTLIGIISTLKDNIILTSASVGKEFLPTAKKLALMAIDITQKLGKWVKENKETVVTLGKIAAVIALIGPALITLGIVFKTVAIAISGFVAIAGGGVVLLKGIALAVAAMVSPFGRAFITMIKFAGGWDKLIEKLKNIEIIKTVMDKFNKFKNSFSGLGNIFSSAFNAFDKDVNVNTRQEFKGAATKPVAQSRSPQNNFQGNLDIAIADKGKNVQSARLSSNGGLNLGVSGVGM